MAFIDELKQGLTEVGKTVYEKSEQFISIQKLKMKRNSLKNELKDTYAEIGKQVFEERKAGSEFSGVIVQLCQKVEMGQEAIAEVDAQIKEVKEREEYGRPDVTDEPPKADEVVVEATETEEPVRTEEPAKTEDAPVKAEDAAEDKDAPAEETSEAPSEER